MMWPKSQLLYKLIINGIFGLWLANGTTLFAAQFSWIEKSYIQGSPHSHPLLGQASPGLSFWGTKNTDHTNNVPSELGAQAYLPIYGLSPNPRKNGWLIGLSGGHLQRISNDRAYVPDHFFWEVSINRAQLFRNQISQKSMFRGFLSLAFRNTSPHDDDISFFKKKQHSFHIRMASLLSEKGLELVEQKKPSWSLGLAFEVFLQEESSQFYSLVKASAAKSLSNNTEAGVQLAWMKNFQEEKGISNAFEGGPFVKYKYRALEFLLAAKWTYLQSSNEEYFLKGADLKSQINVLF